MRSVRGLRVVTGIMFALAVLAPSVSVAADIPVYLLITKECSQFHGHVGDFCTITSSTFAAIPIGTKAIYYGPEINDPNYLSSVVVLNAGHGNRATGYCSLLIPVGGTCSFWEGTGTLAGFHAAVQVTSTDGLNFTWTGSYRLDHHH